MDNIIQIAFCICDRDGMYACNTGAAMLSILQHTNSDIHFHIITDNSLLEENKEKLIQIANQYSAEISFYYIKEELLNDMNNPSFCKDFSIGAIYRLIIPEIIQEDKIIYLDSDIFCLKDITEMWNIDIQNYSIAGVLNDHEADLSSCSEVYRQTKASYINSGVIIFNISKIKSENKLFPFIKKLTSFNKQFNTPYLLDQDFLNYIFQGDIKLLDESCNYQKLYNSRDAQDCHNNSIIHYLNSLMTPELINKFDKLFLKTMEQTPWGFDGVRYILKRWYNNKKS